MSQASSIVLVFRSWAWVRCAGVNPIQSLYRLTVRRIVGLPSRQAAIWAYSFWYIGRYFAADLAAHWAPTTDHTGVLLMTGRPQGASAFSSKLLCAMPTRMMSAADSGCLREPSSPSSWGRVRPVCWDRFCTLTCCPVAFCTAWAYWSTNPVHPGQSSGLL